MFMDNDDYPSNSMEGAGGQHHRACLNRHDDELILIRIAVRVLMLGGYHG
jgi:hypothetical protein